MDQTQQPGETESLVPAQAPAAPEAQSSLPSAADEAEVPAQDSTMVEDEWWQDPSMPWKHKPGRSDIACVVWMGVLGIFSMLMLPLRAWLLGAASRIPLMVALTGSRTGTATLGAIVSTGDYSVIWHLGGHDIAISWLWPLLAGVIMSCKFDWIYWWAGKLWGRGMIEVWAGKSDAAARRYERLEKWAQKWYWLAFALAYLPVPLPLMAVVFVLAGASGMRLRRFVVLDLLVCSCWNALFFWLGHLEGAPITYVLRIYNKVAQYVTIALIIGIVITTIYNSVKKARKSASRTSA